MQQKRSQRCLRYSIQAILMEQIPRNPSKTSNRETKDCQKKEFRAIQEINSSSSKQTKGWIRDHFELLIDKMAKQTRKKSWKQPFLHIWSIYFGRAWNSVFWFLSFSLIADRWLIVRFHIHLHRAFLKVLFLIFFISLLIQKSYLLSKQIKKTERCQKRSFREENA